MIEYRNNPDRALLAWQLRRAKRRRGYLDPEAEEIGKPTSIEIAQIHTSPDDPKERNENEPDE